MGTRKSNPFIVLFSGGSASNLLAQHLEQMDARIVNVISVFDNGGSTGSLRRILPLPAMGDIRNRLLALAPLKTPGQRAVKAIFDLRFSERKAENQLRNELKTLISGDHPVALNLPPESKDEILQALVHAEARLPRDFLLRELAVGNLLIFGRALETNDFLAAVEWVRNLLSVRSRVLPVTLQSAHLGAQCKNGHWVLGQAALTNEQSTLPSEIESMHFVERENSYAFQPRVDACPAVLDALRDADAIIVGFGSFLSSILPHFMVRGVGREFVRRSIPKLLACNPTADKETAHLTIADMIDTMASFVRKDTLPDEMLNPMLTHILHFGPSEQNRVQRGDLFRVEAKYFDLHSARTFPAMAQEVCHQLSASIDVAYVPAQGKAPIHAVTMFDLDDTLFDYSGLRLRATADALEGLIGDPRSASSELAEFLRPPLTDALAAFGLPDLRKQWDSPDVYVLAQLLDQPSTRDMLVSVARSAEECGCGENDAAFAEKVRIYRYYAELEKSPVAAGLLKAIADVRDRKRLDLDSRAERFRQFVARNATLLPGAADIFAQLRTLGASIYVVSEGDSPVQEFKFRLLGLPELADACMVSDVTCSVSPVLDELFRGFRNMRDIPDCVGRIFDQLSPYAVKSVPFYSKLIHAFADPAPESLEARLSSPRFLTVEEWRSTQPHLFVMVGDRYRKDLEPLLQLGPEGIRAYRVLHGRYDYEDPLCEIKAAHKPPPNAVFPDLRASAITLSAAILENREAITRPEPILPDLKLLDEVLSIWQDASQISRSILQGIRSEVIRHHKGVE